MPLKLHDVGDVVVVVLVVVVVGALWQVNLPGPVWGQSPEQHSELEEHGVPVAPQASVVVVVDVVDVEVVVLPAGFVVVVVLAGFVVVVVGGPTCAGAQTSCAALGVTVRLPNWSVTVMPDSTPFGHFTL
jgi:hypothetical protein